MPSATTFSRPQASPNPVTQHDARQWGVRHNERGASQWTVRARSSMRAVDKEAEEHLAAMRLLIPLAMILILFVLWYVGMPLLPN